jgi:hypothetical protein
MPSYISEAAVLKPRDPRIKDNNDWEIFTVSNAEVRDAETGELRSLLEAHALTPMTLVGRLQPVGKEQQHLCRTTIHHRSDRVHQKRANIVKLLVKRAEYSKTTPIQVDNICEFAYAAEDTGEILLWAAGKAGWFEIRPGRAYKDIYHDMQEAVNLLFFVEDIYVQSRSKAGNGPSHDMIFREVSQSNAILSNGWLYSL